MRLLAVIMLAAASGCANFGRPLEEVARELHTPQMELAICKAQLPQ